MFLKLEKWEADPKAFLEILEIDQSIGWVNDADVEFSVFYWKGLKIIEDKDVSYKF